MIGRLLEHADRFVPRRDFSSAMAAYIVAVKASAGAGDRGQVVRIEARVRTSPQDAFHFDANGAGMLWTGDTNVPAGRFETPSIGMLRRRAAAVRSRGAGARVRLWVLDGESPATDIGSLQANAPSGTLFQVASQFNCLEAPGPHIAPVAHYFNDPTQGPRASISAFPGTLLRHYAAPGGDGQRFVQTSDGPQLNLLKAVCAPGVATVRNGYLTASGIADPSAFVNALEDRFEEIRVGVHDDVPVLLGYNWDGGVAGTPRIGQVFTSTFAGGGYGGRLADDASIRPICAVLLRAAYLGTLLAAVVLGRRNVVLTLIGGGVFGNPIPLIWESILWAVREIEPLASEEMHVILNGRNLGFHLRIEDILPVVRAYGGKVLVFDAAGVSVRS